MDSILSKHCADRDVAVARDYPGISVPHYVGEVLLDRSVRYAAHVESMVIDPEITLWALAMAQRHGSYVRAYHYVADWITALLIMRYGEEPDAARSSDPNFAGWPTRFTEDDKRRAAELLAGQRWPEGLFTLLTTEG